MDLSAKKRKADENGTAIDTTLPNSDLTPEDIRKIIEPFTQDQFRDIVQTAALRHIDVLDSIRFIADRDPAQRKLFIRGLGNETTNEGLISLFSTYGELAEAIVINDKVTGKSKGYGFITFKHIDGALLALKEPSKQLDGRMTVTQLASIGNPNLNPNPAGNPNVNPTLNAGGDVALRKIYIQNVPVDMTADRLLFHFSPYGEIEEGPFGFDKNTGKSRGYSLFIYKTVEGARNALVEPTKIIDGSQVVCRYAIDKAKPAVPGATAAPTLGSESAGDGVGMQPPSSVPNSLTSQYAAPGGLSSYGGFAGAHQGQPGMMSHHAYGTPGLSSMPSSYGGVGAYGGYGASYPGVGGGPITGAGGYGGLGTGGSSLYNRMPPSSVPSGYPEGGQYSLSSSAFPSQSLPPLGASAAVPRVPIAGMYPGVPPYY